MEFLKKTKRKRIVHGKNDGSGFAFVMSEDQFFEWANRRSRLPLAVKGHSLVMKGDNIITIDRGQFLYEEALQIVRMLNSQNPIVQMNATLTIWERNGTFRLIALALIAIILVAVFVLARR